MWGVHMGRMAWLHGAAMCCRLPSLACLHADPLLYLPPLCCPQSRQTGAGGDSPAASAAVSEASRRSSRRSHTPENVRGSVTSVGQASSGTSAFCAFLLWTHRLVSYAAVAGNCGGTH